LLRTDAVEGGQVSHEDKVSTAITARLLDRNYVRRRFDNT
jgi:hypothetical protein